MLVAAAYVNACGIDSVCMPTACLTQRARYNGQTDVKPTYDPELHKHTATSLQAA